MSQNSQNQYKIASCFFIMFVATNAINQFGLCIELYIFILLINADCIVYAQILS